MRLIDGEALYKQVAESEEKARDRFLDTSSSLPCPSYINPAYTRYNEQLNERTRLKHMIADAPTIELSERKGHWILSDDREWKTCSECGAEVDVSMGTGVYDGVEAVSEMRFCPNCGVRMIGGEDDEAD